MSTASQHWEVEFYGETDSDPGPVRRWFREKLTPLQRRSLGVAMWHILQQMGPDVTKTNFGTDIGGGIFEFRLDKSDEEILQMLNLLPLNQAPAQHDRLLLRVFCHAHGNRLIVLLLGYDKLKQPHRRYQQEQIKEARRRLAEIKNNDLEISPQQKWLYVITYSHE